MEKPPHAISYGICREYLPIWVSVSVLDQNQNSGFGRPHLPPTAKKQCPKHPQTYGEGNSCPFLQSLQSSLHYNQEANRQIPTSNVAFLEPKWWLDHLSHPKPPQPQQFHLESAHQLLLSHSCCWQVSCSERTLQLWQYRLWNFQGRDTKLERFLAKNQLQSNEIIEFWELEQWRAVKN